jgi:hypothetical protein
MKHHFTSSLSPLVSSAPALHQAATTASRHRRCRRCRYSAMPLCRGTAATATMLLRCHRHCCTAAKAALLRSRHRATALPHCRHHQALLPSCRRCRANTLLTPSCCRPRHRRCRHAAAVNKLLLPPPPPHQAAAAALPLPLPSCRHRHHAATTTAALPSPLPSRHCCHHQAATAAAPLPSRHRHRAAAMTICMYVEKVGKHVPSWSSCMLIQTLTAYKL